LTSRAFFKKRGTGDSARISFHAGVKLKGPCVQRQLEKTIKRLLLGGGNISFRFNMHEVDNWKHFSNTNPWRGYKKKKRADDDDEYKSIIHIDLLLKTSVPAKDVFSPTMNI